MRLLLDTHTFLWFIRGSDELSEYARQLIEDTENERLLSIASLWEIAIKASIGKLELKLSMPDLVARQVEGNAIQLLRIEPEHLDLVENLPLHHRDPFDRLIIAQGTAAEIPVISRDRAFVEYAVEQLWSKKP